jgi:hypothetical protein
MMKIGISNATLKRRGGGMERTRVCKISWLEQIKNEDNGHYFVPFLSDSS